MNLPLHVVSETASTITLGWTPPPAARGYIFTANGKRSHTLDATRSTVKFAKPGPYSVEAMGTLAQGVWPDASPPALGSQVGSAPAPLPGPPILPQNTSALLAAAAGAKPGYVIDGQDRTFDLAGGTLRLPRLTGRAELRNAKIVNGGSNCNVRADGTSANWTLRSIASDKGGVDGFKITDDSDGIWLVDCSASDNTRQGFNTSNNAANWLMWNCRAYRNGRSTLDHNWYVGAAKGDCRILNPYSESPVGYGIQIQYANVQKLLVTMAELKGGTTQRGGFVLSDGATNATIIGPYVHDCATEACLVYKTVSGCVVYDGYEERNNGGWAAGPGVTYVRPHHGAAGPVDPSQYPWVPAFDINGKPRPDSPKAGCFA